MKPPKPGPHQMCRSLLQKAVRRGDVELVTRVAEHLRGAGEEKWLHARAHVIAFEESWPIFGAPGDRDADAQILLRRAASAVKSKQAAGLGSLAYAFSAGRALPPEEARDHAVRVVASGLLRPQELWAWARREARDERSHAVVLAASSAYGLAGWPRDKTILLAAAYLAATEGAPEAARSSRPPLPCPLWVAVDHHTEEGRAVLRRVAREARLPYAAVTLLCFCCEGSLANEESPSPWWERDVRRRLREAKLEPAEAEGTWARLRARVERELAGAVAQLAEHLSGPAEGSSRSG